MGLDEFAGYLAVVWRDFGYVAGGLLVGVSSDWLRLTGTINVVDFIILISAMVVPVRMYCSTQIKSATCFQQ